MIQGQTSPAPRPIFRQPGLRASPRFGTLIHGQPLPARRPILRQPGLRASPRFGTMIQGQPLPARRPSLRQPGPVRFNYSTNRSTKNKKPSQMNESTRHRSWVLNSIVLLTQSLALEELTVELVVEPDN